MTNYKSKNKQQQINKYENFLYFPKIKEILEKNISIQEQQLEIEQLHFENKYCQEFTKYLPGNHYIHEYIKDINNKISPTIKKKLIECFLQNINIDFNIFIKITLHILIHTLTVSSQKGFYMKVFLLQEQISKDIFTFLLLETDKLKNFVLRLQKARNDPKEKEKIIQEQKEVHTELYVKYYSAELKTKMSQYITHILGVLVENNFIQKAFQKEITIDFKLEDPEEMYKGALYILNPNKDIKEFETIGFGNISTLPMLVKPEKWSLDTTTGGFLSNQQGTMSFVLNKKNPMCSINFNPETSEKYFKYINKTQEVPLEVNTDVLGFMLSNFDTLVEYNFLVDDSLLTVIDPNKTKIENQKARSKAYDQCLAFAWGLTFSNKPLYIVRTVDIRGRIYSASSISTQVNSFVKSLLRFHKVEILSKKNEIYNWLAFGGACYLSSFETDQECVDFINNNTKKIISLVTNKDKLTKEDLDFLMKAKDEYLFLAFCFEYKEYINNKKEYVNNKILSHIDATQSAIQIFSGLTRDMLLAKLTNLFSKSKKEDYYGYITNLLIPELKNPVNLENFVNYKKKETIKKNKKNKTTKKIIRFEKDTDRIMFLKFFENEQNLNLLNNRKIFKKLIMCLPTYGMTFFTAQKELENYITINNLFDLDKKLKDNITVYITQMLITLLKIKAKSQYDVLNLFKYVIKNLSKETIFFKNKTEEENESEKNQNSRFGFKGKSFNFCLNKFWYTVSRYPKQEKKDLTFKVKSQKFSNVAYVNIIKEVIDKNTNEKTILILSDTKNLLTSATANFVHSIDATICIEMIIELFENGVTSLSTNHDCFFISPKYFSLARKCYASIFNRIFDEKNLLEIFEYILKNNIFKEQKKSKKILKKMTSKSLLEEIKVPTEDKEKFSLKDMMNSKYFLS